MTLTELAALWQTAWAHLLLALLSLLSWVGLLVVWRAKRARLRREEEYSHRLQQEVRRRMAELRDRNDELRAANQQLLEASLTDSLTGLRNRRFLFEQVARDISLVRRRFRDLAAGGETVEGLDLVFMMIDLDHFKAINDSLGHASGDRVLVEVRNILLENCRDSDVVIRWGGDEFLVVARDTDADQAEILAERIRSRIEHKGVQLTQGQVVRTTCSIGFACYPFVRSRPDLVSWEQVITLADGALYHSKKTRNSWTGFAAAMRSGRGEELMLSLRDEPEDLVRQGILDIRAYASGSVAAS